MLCPLFREECAEGCAWMVRSHRRVDGVLVDERVCVLIALARELARRKEADDRQQRKFR